MPSEHQRVVPKKMPNPPVVQQVNTGAKALPAVKPFQQKEIGETQAASAMSGSLPVPAGGVGVPLQVKTSVPAGKPVVQRALHTKESIFLDQLKHQLVKGVFNYDPSGGDEYSVYLKQLEGAGLIKVDDLVYETYIDRKKGKGKTKKRKTQEDYYDEEKDKGLAPITSQTLRNHDLLIDGLSIAEKLGKWGEYKPAIDNKRKAKGTGGRTITNTKVKTRVRWDKVDTNSKEGKKAEALVLGPDHPLGTTPKSSEDDQTAVLSEKTGQGYIRGHLLNDHLGGPGTDARNIAAIPKDVNTEQSDKIEEKVKDKVNNKHEVVYYSVEASYDWDSKLKVYYASELKSVFGTYKEGTKFHKLNYGSVPSTELADLFVHQLPIRKPSEYKKDGAGYKTKDDDTYSNNTSRDPKETTSRGTNAPAIFNVNKERDILLKDAKQVKLEFISYAIFSVPIDKLNTKVKGLEEEIVQKDKLLQSKGEELLEKDTKLGEREAEVKNLQGDVQKNNDLMERLQAGLFKIYQELNVDKQAPDKSSKTDQEDLKQIEVLLGKVAEEFGVLRQQLGSLEKELQNVRAELEKVRAELEKTKLERDQYQQSSREGAWGLGFSNKFLSNLGLQQRNLPQTYSPLSRSFVQEGSEEAGLYIKKLEEEKEFTQGQLAAGKKQQEVIERGYKDALEQNQLPDDVAAALESAFWILFGRESLHPSFLAGYTKGIRELAPAYISGFKQGLKELDNQRLLEENRLLKLEKEAQKNWPQRDRRRSRSKDREKKGDEGLDIRRLQDRSQRDKKKSLPPPGRGGQFESHTKRIEIEEDEPQRRDQPSTSGSTFGKGYGEKESKPLPPKKRYREKQRHEEERVRTFEDDEESEYGPDRGRNNYSDEEYERDQKKRRSSPSPKRRQQPLNEGNRNDEVPFGFTRSSWDQQQFDQGYDHRQDNFGLVPPRRDQRHRPNPGHKRTSGSSHSRHYRPSSSILPLQQDPYYQPNLHHRQQQPPRFVLDTPQHYQHTPPPYHQPYHQPPRYPQPDYQQDRRDQHPPRYPQQDYQQDWRDQQHDYDHGRNNYFPFRKDEGNY